MQLTDWTQSWSKTQTCSPHEAISLNKLRSNESNSGVPAQKVIKSSSWRPMYLTPASLALFSTVFLACLASVQTVFAISNRNRGLSGENDVLHRVLWSYGPVAILTLVSSFWARLETQAKTTSSWLSMARGNTRACQSLLLDYTSQLQPISVISALRYKDYTVAAATIASLLLKILLVLATSLITLSPATVVKQHNISLNLKSEFVDNSNGILANGSLASVYFASMMNFNTTLPQGVSDTYAYQLVESDLLDTPSTLNTTVDGFLGEIDCEPANLYPNGLALNISKSTFLWGYDHNDSIPITAGSCSFQVYPNRVLSGLDGEIEDGDYIVGLQSGVCNDSDSKDNHRLAIIVASLAMSGEDIITFARSNCLICTPTYRILPLDLSAQGPDRLLRPSSGRDSRLLRNVHPWDILNTHANAVPPDQTLHNSSAKISNQTVWFDEHGYLAYQFANKSGNPPTLSTILDGPVGLTEFFSNYYQQYSALFAHTSLMQPASISSKGSADEVKGRFLVQSLVANSMTAIIVTCLLISILIWVIRASTKLELPQNPTTMIGLAMCLSSGYSIMEMLNGMGGRGRDSLQSVIDGYHYRTCLNRNDGSFEVLAEESLLPNDDLEMWPPEQSVFKPFSLKLSVRLTVAIILLATIISLEATLRLSKRDQGLGNVPLNREIISYFWSAFPGLVFTLIGLYYSSLDFDTRSLAPYLHLVRGSGFISSISLDLVNKHTLLLLYEETKTRSFESLASTLAVTLTSFLTIFSSGLFTSAIATSNLPTELHVTKPIWYNTRGAACDFGWPDYSINSAALILASNLSYSSFTYEDLILPALEVNKTFLSAHPNTSAIEFNTTLLAARPSFTQCRVFNSSQIHVNFTSWRDIGVRVNIDSEECLWYGRDVSSNLNIPLPLAGDSLEDEADIDSLFDEYEHPEYLPLSAEAYFAVGGGTRGSGIQARGCSQRLWVWGQWSTSTIQEVDSPQAISVSALACNESMETVEVEALLFGPDLSIKPSRPPIPHQSATSSVDMRWFINEGVDYNLGHYPDYDLYNGLPYLSTNTTDMLFDPFFTLLTTSRYAVPLDMLGNQSHASTVAEAIKFHHRIIAAQRTAASLERIPSGNISMHNWGYEIVPGTNETSYHATSSIPLDRYRVVQNEFSTRVLQGLLIGILICSLVNWYLIYLTGGSGALPRSPNTIANTAALLVDGNLIELLRLVNCQSLDLQAVRDHLGRDTVFRLGWCTIAGREEQVYCIYADDNSYKVDLLL